MSENFRLFVAVGFKNLYYPAVEVFYITVVEDYEINAVSVLSIGGLRIYAVKGSLLVKSVTLHNALNSLVDRCNNCNHKVAQLLEACLL